VQSLADSHVSLAAPVLVVFSQYSILHSWDLHDQLAPENDPFEHCCSSRGKRPVQSLALSHDSVSSAVVLPTAPPFAPLQAKRGRARRAMARDFMGASFRWMLRGYVALAP